MIRTRREASEKEAPLLYNWRHAAQFHLNRGEDSVERTEEPFAAPVDIQRFLNALPYNPKPECKSPARVLREGTAHCFEGALFAASKLRDLGYHPF